MPESFTTRLNDYLDAAYPILVVETHEEMRVVTDIRQVVANRTWFDEKETNRSKARKPVDYVDLALINTNYAIEAKLNPTKDSLFLESGSSHYANFIAARKDRANDPSILKLVKALRTPEVKKFIQDKYKGAIIPAF